MRSDSRCETWEGPTTISISRTAVSGADTPRILAGMPEVGFLELPGPGLRSRFEHRLHRADVRTGGDVDREQIVEGLVLAAERAQPHPVLGEVLAASDARGPVGRMSAA